MARPDPPSYNSNVVSDSLSGFMDGLGKLLLYGGGLVAAASILILVYQVFSAGSASGDELTKAVQVQEYFRQGSLWGLLAASLGAAWLFWGEEIAGPILLIVGLAMALMSWYMPGVLQGAGNELQGNAIEYLSAAGYPAVFVGLILIVGDAVQKTRIRMKEGAKAEQMKYGKGMKEERDVRDVFLGKCWQLPYCRKFVRERCPIYHAKRTCWKERVGCMCEESVIKNAMEGKSQEGQTLSKDLVAASKFIPKNNKLSAAAKAERCRQCVIYNEHQKHKYKLFLPIIALSVAAAYIVLRPVLADVIQNALRAVDGIYKGAILTGSDPNNAGRATSIDGGAVPYNEIILFVLMLVGMAYAIKVLEFLVWKLKI